MDLRIALAVALVCTLTACGGGGDGDGPGPDLKCVTQPQAVLSGTLYMNTGVHSGDSAGASDGGGDGDGAGSLGQFRKTLVIVRDKNLNEIGRAVTDEENGAVTIRLGDCRDPIEVEYAGGDGATYFDGDRPVRTLPRGRTTARATSCAATALRRHTLHGGGCQADGLRAGWADEGAGQRRHPACQPARVGAAHGPCCRIVPQ